MVGEMSDDYITAIYLLMPAAIFALVQFKDNLKFLDNKLFITIVVISIICIGLYCMEYFGMKNEVNEFNALYFNNISASFTFWFLLSFIFYVAICFLSIMCRRTLKKNKTTAA